MSTMTLAEVTTDENGVVTIEHGHGSLPDSVMTDSPDHLIMHWERTASTFTVSVYGQDQKQLRNTDVSFRWQVYDSAS